MGHHVVPQLYLQGFSDPARTGFIWRYEKGQPAPPRPLPIKGVAQSPGFYRPEVEAALNREIEVPAKPALEALRRLDPLDGEMRFALCRYMQVMLYRVERRREEIKNYIPAALDSSFAELDRMFSERSARDLSRAPFWASKCAEAEQLKRAWSTEIPHDVWTEAIQPRVRPNIVRVLWDMTWVYCVATTDLGFLTSDDPVSFDVGLGLSRSDFVFPISAEVTVLGTHGDGVNEGYAPVTREVVERINRATIGRARRWLFYPSDDPWVRNEVAAKATSLDRRRHHPARR
jgi:Protein of unknown function (DUF4238)